jgi:soluble lytic murein transglycosylase-like protein
MLNAAAGRTEITIESKDIAQDKDMAQDKDLFQGKYRVSGRSMAQGADAKAGGASLYRAAIERHARENSVPSALANAVIRIESNYNAKVLHAGNYGLMQIRLATARSVGFADTPSALLDPETNLHFGLRYLSDMYRQAGGDLCHTIMKYQSGHLAVHMNAANRLYCQRVKSLMASN